MTLMQAPMRGELWWCEPPEIGRRPVVVLSRDAAIPRLRRALIAPCTTTIRKLASEVIPSLTPIRSVA
jgi:mRNA interferase MazF